MKFLPNSGLILSICVFLLLELAWDFVKIRFCLGGRALSLPSCVDCLEIGRERISALIISNLM